jgi:hypothetical protein
MDLMPTFASPALWATLLLLLSLALLAMRWRQHRNERRPSSREAVDTVGGWPPEAARALTVSEREAHELLRRAAPGLLVLAQVPLSRFIRVPSRHSYADWLQRVGSLSADLLLCDAGSRVLAVVDIRSGRESERGRRRHQRMTRVLEAAGIRVFVWNEAALPAAGDVRQALAALVQPKVDQIRPTASRPMPLIPVAEVLAAGDRAAFGHDDTVLEPVPSAFFEELEPAALRQ